MSAVVVEVLALAVLSATGWLLAPSRHGASWRLVVALPLGVAALACAELVLLAVHVPVAHPWVAAVGALTVALVTARGRGRDEHPPARAATAAAGGSGVGVTGLAVALGVVILTVLVTALVPLANVSSDSFRYLTVAQLLAEDGHAGRMSAFLLQSRGLVVGVVHGLALPDLGYLRAFGPLVAMSTLGALWLLVLEGLRGLDPRTARWVAGAAVLLLGTNHRFVFNAFYVNGHLLFAVWLLLLTAVVWRRLLLTDDEGGVGDPLHWGGGVVAAVLAAGLAVLRPEGALVALLAITPAVLDPDLPRRWRQAVLVALGTAVAAWHLFVVIPLREAPPNLSLWGMVALAAALLAGAALLPTVDRWRARGERSRRGRVLVALHLLLWVAVGALAAGEPSILLGTVESIGRNVLDKGAWGSSLLVLAGLLVLVVSVRRVVGERALLFPLLGFVPLAVLLNFARGGPGREGPGDSLNRMLLHLLPLAVWLLALAAESRPRRTADAREPVPSDGDRDEHARAVLGGGKLDG